MMLSDNTLRKIGKAKFVVWGIAANFYGYSGKIFKSRKLMDKSVMYFDKRWAYMIAKLYMESHK